MARPEGVEPPTAWFVARYSIQLSYGRLTKMSSIHQYIRESTPLLQKIAIYIATFCNKQKYQSISKR